MGQDDAELLAAVLDGELAATEVPAELARLSDLAGLVHATTSVAAPTAAFTTALRHEVLQTFGTAATTAGGATAAGSSAAGSGTAAAAAAGPAQAATAAVLAATVLTTSAFAAAAHNAVPGDLLYETKRTTEATQLLLSSDARDAELLLGFATNRVREAAELTDPDAVLAALDEAGSQVHDALSLVAALELDVAELLDTWAVQHTDALLQLSSVTTDDAVSAAVGRMLSATMGLQDVGDVSVIDIVGDTPGGDWPSTGDGSPGDAGTDDSGDSGDDGGGDDDGGDSSGGDVTDDVDDTIDDVDDTIDDTIDDVDDTIDDTIDDVDDTIDDITDDVDDTIDDTVDGLGDATDDVTGLLGGD